MEELYLLQQLEQQWHTAAELAAMMHCSEKTIRTHLHHMAPRLPNDAAAILTSPGKGFFLAIHDMEAYQRWRQRQYQERNIFPDDTSQRVHWILSRLLHSTQYCKRAEMARQLYVSEKTISKDLRLVANILAQYQLQMEHRPGYGIRLRGNEFRLRQCLLNEVINDMDQKDETVKEVLHHMIAAMMKENNISSPSYARQSMIDYLALSIKRIREGYTIQDERSSQWPEDVGIFYMSRYLMESIVHAGLIRDYPLAEVYYLSLYLWANRFFDEDDNGMPNYHIRTSITPVFHQIITTLQNHYGLSIASSFYFQRCLQNQIAATEIRMQYRIHVKNPDKETVFQNCPAASYIAMTICHILSQSFHTTAFEDDISFLALLLHPYLPEKTPGLRILYLGRMSRPEEHDLLHHLKDDCIQEIQIADPGEISTLHAQHPDIVISFTCPTTSLHLPFFLLDYDDGCRNWKNTSSHLHKIYKEKQIAACQSFEHHPADQIRTHDKRKENLHWFGNIAIREVKMEEENNLHYFYDDHHGQRHHLFLISKDKPWTSSEYQMIDIAHNEK